ncbi:MAG: hypothetical protein WBO82_03160 [Neisseria sp.]
MKTNFKIIVSAVTLLTALSGCSTFGSDKKAEQPAAPVTQATAPVTPVAPAEQAQPKRTVDSVKEVAYSCGPKGADKLRVTYGLNGNDIVAAQVLFQDKPSPVLSRVEEVTDQNVFTASGISWTTSTANAANVDKVNGNQLLQASMTTVNGKEQRVEQVVTNNCKLDKQATARLQAAPKK